MHVVAETFHSPSFLYLPPPPHAPCASRASRVDGPGQRSALVGQGSCPMARRVPVSGGAATRAGALPLTPSCLPEALGSPSAGTKAHSCDKGLHLALRGHITFLGLSPNTGLLCTAGRQGGVNKSLPSVAKPFLTRRAGTGWMDVCLSAAPAPSRSGAGQPLDPLCVRLCPASSGLSELGHYTPGAQVWPLSSGTQEAGGAPHQDHQPR